MNSSYLHSTQAMSNPSYMKYILVVGNIMGVMPLNVDRKIFKVYVILLLPISLVGYVDTIRGKQLYYATVSSFHLIRVMQYVEDFLLVLTSVSASVIFVFLCPHKFRKMCTNLTSISEKLCVAPKTMKKLFWCLFLFMNLATMIGIVLKLWALSSNRKLPVITYYAFKYFQRYLKETILLVWSWFVIDIGLRFRALNQSLRKTASECVDFRVVSTMGASMALFDERNRKLDRLSNFYNILCDLIADVNKLFGLLLFIIITVEMISFLRGACNMIFFAAMNPGTNDVSFGANFFVVHGSFLVFVFVRVLAIAAVGDFMTKAANETVKVCYDAMDTQDARNWPRTELLKKRLEMLARQVIYRKPSLSAGGFYTVDFTMMGFIVTSVTSYIIVAIQFLRDR